MVWRGLGSLRAYGLRATLPALDWLLLDFYLRVRTILLFLKATITACSEVTLQSEGSLGSIKTQEESCVVNQRAWRHHPCGGQGRGETSSLGVWGQGVSEELTLCVGDSAPRIASHSPGP